MPQLQGIDPATVTWSDHFKNQFRAKNFTVAQIRVALLTPEKITAVTRYPGQLRYCGGGIAVVLRGNVAVTIYEDGVITERRADQADDVEAVHSRRLARRERQPVTYTTYSSF